MAVVFDFGGVKVLNKNKTILYLHIFNLDERIHNLTFVTGIKCMKNQILNIIKNHKKKNIKVHEIDFELKNKGIDIWFNLSLSPEFNNVINELIDEGILIIMKSSTQLQVYNGLFDKYSINKSFFKSDNILTDDQLYVEMLALSSKLNISYYQKNRDEYIKNRDYILKIDNLLTGVEDLTITANERAYELFGDEKALTAPEDAVIDGNQILKNLNLTYEDIKAERVFEPFVYLKNKDFDYLQNNSKRNILIIENKDTYWTFQYAMMQGILNKIQLVIYGEGKAILNKFKFIEEVGGIPSDDYYYFGDIDAEGINIYNQLHKKYLDYNIFPAVFFYEYILKKEGPENAKPIRTNQEIKDFTPFIEFFEAEIGEMIKTIVLEKRYFPQEAINKKDIVELKGIGL